MHVVHRIKPCTPRTLHIVDNTVDIAGKKGEREGKKGIL